MSIPPPPSIEADYQRVLNASAKLLEALENLVDRNGLKRLTPAQVANLLPMLTDVKAEAEAALPVLERAVNRPLRAHLRHNADRRR